MQRLQAELAIERSHADRHARALQAMEATVSWRVTRPLRTIRRLLARRTDDVETPARSAEPPPTVADHSPERWLHARADAAAAVLARQRVDPGADGLGRLTAAIEASEESAEALAWLASVAVLATYPTDTSLDRAARVLRAEGAAALIESLRDRLAAYTAAGGRSDRGLRIVSDRVVVDVNHTLTHDLHTGIQRVVRETVSRWLVDHPIVLCGFDFDAGHTVALAATEHERLLHWQRFLHDAGAAHQRRLPQSDASEVLVPWHVPMVLPELVTEPARCDVYRAMARAGVISRLGVVGFDCIPVTSFETVTDGMSDLFASYLSLVKYADALSAISHSTANDFEAFCTMLTSQGLDGPAVGAHPLPIEPRCTNTAYVDRVRERLMLESSELVLVVGSHEPRKNHGRVLEVAERLWSTGVVFHLLFIGGSGWRSEEFDATVIELQRRGRPVTVWRRASEDELWAAYELARFSLFPSLVEGFGLPVAESLACGTPVITSNFGSMAEIAAPGGAILVDPRDTDALAMSMAELLSDDALLVRLGDEARARSWGSWNDYAAGVWAHLVGSSEPTTLSESPAVVDGEG